MKKAALSLLLVFLLLGCATVTKYRPEKVPRQKRKRIPQFSCEICADHVTPEKDVFKDKEQPIIGIFGFTDNGKDIPALSTQLYDALKYDPGMKMISCQELKDHYELSRISRTNTKLLSDIKKDFNIEYVVYGRLMNRTNNEFRISIMSLDTYMTVFEFDVKDSGNSSAIQDVIMYFERNKVPVYNTDQVRSGYTDSTYTVYETRQIAYQEKRLDIPKVLGVIVLALGITYLLTKN